jgi:hypothetical protein
MKTLHPSHADKCRAAALKWAGRPPGIPPDIALEFMAKLNAGSTVRKLTAGGKECGPTMVSRERFKKHCELNPIWAAEVWRISDANTRQLKGGRYRSVTHCKHGHLLSEDNVYFGRSRPQRHCIACIKRRSASPLPASSEQIQRATAALNAGKTISQICWGKRDGRVTERRILSFSKLKLHRELNPAFDRFLLSAIADNNAKGQLRRHHPERARIEIIRSENDDFHKILGMLRPGLANRDEIATAIFLALANGTLQRDQVKLRLQEFVLLENRMFPIKYRKFGNSTLVSLDDLMFDDGTTTRGDTVSRGLWD